MQVRNLRLTPVGERLSVTIKRSDVPQEEMKKLDFSELETERQRSIFGGQRMVVVGEPARIMKLVHQILGVKEAKGATQGAAKLLESAPPATPQVAAMSAAQTVLTANATAVAARKNGKQNAIAQALVPLLQEQIAARAAAGLEPFGEIEMKCRECVSMDDASEKFIGARIEEAFERTLRIEWISVHNGSATISCEQAKR